MLYDIFFTTIDVRLEWSSSPIIINYIQPFIVRILNDSIEIHDIITLTSLQRIPLQPLQSTSSFTSNIINYSFNSCYIDPLSGIEYGYLCNNESIHIIRMIPLSIQIKTLEESNYYEEALNLYLLCNNNPQLRDININTIYEKYALYLYQRGEFESSIINYIKADCYPMKVLSLFPDLIPQLYHGLLGISSNSSIIKSTNSNTNSNPNLSSNLNSNMKRMSITNPNANNNNSNKLTDVILQRAAIALVQYCEYYRNTNYIKDKIELAEKFRNSLNQNNSTNNLNSNFNSNFNSNNNNNNNSMNSMNQMNNEMLENSEYGEIFRLIEIIDTVLLSALLACYPIKLNSIIQLLSNKNYCNIIISTELLVINGTNYIEALLWLYRINNQHEKVLNALTIDKCISIDFWNFEQFYQWTYEYLNILWYSDNIKDVSLVLYSINNNYKLLCEYSLELGLNVLINNQIKSNNTSNLVINSSINVNSITNSVTNSLTNTNFGGKNIDIREILSFLENIDVSSNNSTNNSHNNSKQSNKYSIMNCKLSNNANSIDNLVSIPLINGKALSISYLEWRILHNNVNTIMHDEYAKLLLESIPLDV